MRHSFQMHQAVDKEEFEKIGKGTTKKSRVPPRFARAKHYLAGACGKREAQNVRRRVHAAIFLVQSPHLVSPDEHNAQLVALFENSVLYL